MLSIARYLNLINKDSHINADHTKADCAWFWYDDTLLMMRVRHSLSTSCYSGGYSEDEDYSHLFERTSKIIQVFAPRLGQGESTSTELYTSSVSKRHQEYASEMYAKFMEHIETKFQDKYEIIYVPEPYDYHKHRESYRQSIIIDTNVYIYSVYDLKTDGQRTTLELANYTAIMNTILHDSIQYFHWNLWINKRYCLEKKLNNGKSMFEIVRGSPMLTKLEYTNPLMTQMGRLLFEDTLNYFRGKAILASDVTVLKASVFVDESIPLVCTSLQTTINRQHSESDNPHSYDISIKWLPGIGIFCIDQGSGHGGCGCSKYMWNLYKYIPFVQSLVDTSDRPPAVLVTALNDTYTTLQNLGLKIDATAVRNFMTKDKPDYNYKEAIEWMAPRDYVLMLVRKEGDAEYRMVRVTPKCTFQDLCQSIQQKFKIAERPSKLLHVQSDGIRVQMETNSDADAYLSHIFNKNGADSYVAKFTIPG